MTAIFRALNDEQAVPMAPSRQGDLMRILHLVNKLDFGGIRKHVTELSDGMRDFGIQSWIAAWTPSDSDLRRRSDFMYLPLYDESGEKKSVAGFYRSIGMVKALLRSERIDILHMHSRFVTAVGAAAVRGSGCHRMYTVHNDFRDLRFLPWYPPTIIAPSEEIMRSYVRNIGARGTAGITVVRHGVPEVDLEGSSPEERNEFLFVGRLEKEKRPDLIIEAFSLLPERERSGVLLKFFGLGREERRLGMLVTEKHLTGFVRFEGHVHDPQRHLARAAALLFPSDALDAMPYSILESNAVGVPVIASDLPQLRELVEHKKTGLLFASGDAAALAEALHYAIQHSGEMREMGLRARAFVRERHSMKQMLENTLRVYRSLLAR